MERTTFLVASAALLATLTAGAPTKKIDFRRDIAPILEKKCFECHYPGTSSSGLGLKDRQELIETGNLIPGHPGKSFFYKCMVDGWMPPAGKLISTELALLRAWILQGAPWPAGVALSRTENKAPAPVAPSAELETVKAIRERILAKKPNAAKPASYKVTIPNTTVAYEMTPIPAGEFPMGAGSANAPHKADETPQHRVKVDAFWMQTREVTWDEFHLFMFAAQANETRGKDKSVDAISRPTHPYVEMSFGMGIQGFPAISMTQHAANKYAEWLSAKTGEFYRLPTEAEWEYACKANSAPGAGLADVAWFSANSTGKYQKVGTKKPNAWGLFDMLGNVTEWTLDQYEPYTAAGQTNPRVPPKTPYPIVARGGSWIDLPEQLSCEERIPSDPSWKQQDPQLPKSIWYETDAPWLGFRLVRPAKVPSVEAMYRFWNNGVEHDEQ